MIPSAHHMEQRGLAMMGRQKNEQGQLFYSFCLDEVVPDDHLVREYRCRSRSVVGARRAGALLSHDRATLDRSSAHDPNADRGLCIRHPLGTVALPRGQGQPRLPVVLRLEHRGHGPGPLGILARPQRALPRQRHLPMRVRAGGGGVHRGRSCRRRRLRGRCQSDRARMPTSSDRSRARTGTRSATLQRRAGP